MTRHEEIFAAVGAVKVVKLRGTSNELLATARKVGEVGRLGRCRQWLLAKRMHNLLMGFLPRP